MKDKLSPAIVEDVIPPENQNKWGKQDVKPSSPIDNPIKSSDKNLKSFAYEYTIEITEKMVNNVDQIIYIPWPWEICRETGVSFDGGSKLHKMILTRIEDLLLWWIEWDWIWIDWVVSDEGIVFKNAPVSHMDN